jgi:hypothetical protein
VIRLDAGGNRHLRLDGLLVEDGAFLPRGKNPFEPIGRKEPASEVWILTSQRKALRPVSSIGAAFMQRPLRISACGSLAFA